MAKIHLLDEYTVNQIAAGEVVERPSSIIKELIENSIDAGSSAITIEIKGGGISFIRVTDNGEGMDMQDAVLSFERHATSKIQSTPDLNRIHTLGFRGEALASIAAVTQIEMVTRAKDNISGIQIINHGGTIISQREIGCPEGTTIVVKNLFYNTPARLKFLKSPRSETAHISDLVSRMILAHPEISFKYINDGKIIYHSPGDGKIESAIISIYGKVIDQLLEINYKDSYLNLELKGFLGKPSLSRTNRNYQSFFVNGRYIKSQLLSSSVENAYKPYMMVNHFPWVILYLTIPPESADVNVHPSKTEIRFKEEEKISEIVHNAVSNAINSQTTVPEIKDHGTQVAKIQVENKNHEQTQMFHDVLSLKSLEAEKVEENPKKIYITKSESLSADKPENTIHNDSMKHGIFANTITGIPSSFKIIGRVFSTYVVVEGQEKVFFIDQHAAHERLIFEEYKDMISRQQVISQQILPPIVIEVTHAEQIILDDSLDKFNALGFEIEPFGGRSYVIRGVPTILGPYNIREFFQDLLDQSKNINPESRYQLRIEDIMKMACKRAVKARDPLSDLEIAALIERLQKTKFL
jgi:DNA mismatch repair protein MutL